MPYVVAKGRSVMVPPRNGARANAESGILKEGALIPDGLMDAKEIERQLRAGFIVRVGARSRESHGEVEQPVVNVQNSQDKQKAVNIFDEKNKVPQTSDRVVSTTPNGVSQTTARPQPPVKNRVSIWDMNPDTIKDKSLDELKVMIGERDADFDLEQVQSVSDAVDILSQDFKTE